MTVRIHNRITAGNNAYYDAEFYHETGNGLERDDLTLGGILFDISDGPLQIEEWVQSTFTSIYPNETLTNITIE